MPPDLLMIVKLPSVTRFLSFWKLRRVPKNLAPDFFSSMTRLPIIDLISCSDAITFLPLLYWNPRFLREDSSFLRSSLCFPTGMDLMRLISSRSLLLLAWLQIGVNKTSISSSRPRISAAFFFAKAIVRSWLVSFCLFSVIFTYVTAPRRKRRDFPLLRPLPSDWRIYTGLHGQKRRVPPLLIPIFLAVECLWPRWCRGRSALHAGHTHCRWWSGISDILWPHSLHCLELENHWTSLIRWRPAVCAFYSSFIIKPCQPASPMARASLWFFIMFADFNVSMMIAWLSSTIVRESLCWKSARALATRSCRAASRVLALLRLALPFFLRDRAFCFRRKLRLVLL